MVFGIIATWNMAYDSICRGYESLKEKIECKDVLEESIKIVEDCKFYTSVGFGGLPNEEGEVELDAAFMDGDTLSIGAIAGIKDYKNPISIARMLSYEKVNNFLIGQGAEKYAHKNGFERKNMLTDESKIAWENKKELVAKTGLSPYDGHDTVGMVSLDCNNSMAAGTSTSGLFMKKSGRIGDSALSGSGFYVDSKYGGATATGLGEDIMKGCVSYQIVQYLKEGMHPQEACDKAVFELDELLVDRRGKSGDISVVCMDNQGRYGASSNVDFFTFAVATQEQSPAIFGVKKQGDKSFIYQIN